MAHGPNQEQEKLKNQLFVVVSFLLRERGGKGLLAGVCAPGRRLAPEILLVGFAACAEATATAFELVNHDAAVLVVVMLG